MNTLMNWLWKLTVLLQPGRKARAAQQYIRGRQYAADTLRECVMDDERIEAIRELRAYADGTVARSFGDYGIEREFDRGIHDECDWLEREWGAP